MDANGLQAMLDSDPELKEWFDTLILRYSLLLMPTVITNSRVTGEQMIAIARSLAHKEAVTVGDPALEEPIFSLLIGYEKARK
jgi:hypothetical protein